MGLFDFFKKKENEPEQPGSNTPESKLFLLIKRYNEYVVSYVGMQQRGNYAPISAYEKPNGEITGFLYAIGKDTSYTLSGQQAITRMEAAFEKRLANQEINSYVILYHSQFANDNNHALAESDDQLKAITVAYHFKEGEKGKIGLTYSFSEGKISYQGFKNFNKEENTAIFKTRLTPDKDYFQDKEEIKSPVEVINGITIKKSNVKDLSNTWSGIFGFESQKKPGATRKLMEYFAFSMEQQPVFAKDGIKVSRVEFSDVLFKSVIADNKPITFLPVIKTGYMVDVENEDIDEWENSRNLEAIVSGKGRNTFALWYFATDYAENRNRYRTEKRLNINISGIVFVLDIFRPEKSEIKLPLSEDFAIFMPNQDVPGQACFDFIGQLEDFRETILLHGPTKRGYIMKVRLITHEVKDFFTIDMYVTHENMRFRELTKGMKITGMFQMQGQIAQ